MLFAGSVVFEKTAGPVDLRNQLNWWTWTRGADWRHPEGPGSSLHGRERHPVVHVAYRDAEAYAAWAGKELPTEAEWEFAARGGLNRAEYAWGDELMPKGRPMANTWQGEFPYENTLADGYEGTSPVGRFPSNGYGLYDMTGNVWEWTTDWYTLSHEPVSPCCAGDPRAASVDPNDAAAIPRRVMKGGSHLCAPNYCRRYRPGGTHGPGDRHLDKPPRLPLRGSGGVAKGDRMPQDKPNILVIWGDDIGITNLSCYSDGLMGYRTPNIDRIANEGMRFTDSYGEQSCTAGRSSFITGQSVFRTGLSKVGVPGSTLGLQAEDPTIAELLKPLGYSTGQFGKNHLGDRNEFLPTVHGFDEFFGNLYHLNAEEEPELPNYPPEKDFPHFRERFGPRGVLRTRATNKDDAREHPRWGRVGKQRIQDTGPLTKKRMETCDDEFVDAACDYIKRQHNRRRPFFCWVNTTHMHLRTHTKRRSLGKAGRWQSPYHDTMLDHDAHVGRLLDLLDELGIADDTIVMYSTDNGPHMNTWPDGGMTPFRNEKNSNWEGAFRVPLAVRWPGNIPAGVVSNEIVQHHDWLPTFLAAAGEPDIVEKLKEGHTAGDKTFKVHIDGFNLLPYLTGEVDKSPRQLFMYFSDDGDVLGIRFDNWKVVFMEQRVPGTLGVWAEPFVPLRLPKLFNLRTDPFERADVTSNTYYDWVIDNAYIVLAASAVVGEFLETFKEFPPRQRAASFTVDQAVEKLEAAIAGAQ